MVLLGVGPAWADLAVSSPVDVTAPVVTNVSIDPLSVDVTDNVNKTFTATLTATDDLSGFAFASLYYQSTSTNQSLIFSFSAYNRTSGDALAGTYTATTTATPTTAGGSYSLQTLWVEDAAGNYRYYPSNDNPAPFSLSVVSDADVLPPSLLSITVDPNPLDVSGGMRTAHVTVHAIDDPAGVVVSGVSAVTGAFTSPTGRQFAAFALSAVPGHPDDVFEGDTQQVVRYAEAGDWNVSYVCVYDRNQNSMCTTPYARPAAPGMEVPLRVISNPADDRAPVVSAFRISPTSGVDLTNGGTTVTTDFDVSDSLSGVKYANITFASPRRAGAIPEVVQRYGFAGAPDVYTFGRNGLIEDDSKRMHGGTLHAQTSFFPNDPSGVWTIEQVCIGDNVNWTTCYYGPSLAAIGPTELTVGGVNTAPSVAVAGVNDTTYVPGSEPTPACDATDAENGVLAATPIVVGPDALGFVTVTCTATDHGGSSSTAVKRYQVVARNTAPVVSVAGVSERAYERGSVPPASCLVADAQDTGESAVAQLGPVTGALSSLGLGTVTVSCSYTDTGGLTGSASLTYSIVDTTAPTLNVASVTAAATSNAGALVSYAASARDAVDPAPRVTCSQASGTVFPIGVTTFSCTAKDASGNTSNGSFTVSVVPTCTASALKEPMNADGSSVFKLGSTIPLKIVVSNCFGTTPAQVAPQVSLRRLDTTADGVVNEVLASGASSEGTTMRVDGSQDMYNLSTKRSQFCSPSGTVLCASGDLTAGTYEVTISAPQFATPVKARFNLRK